MEPNSNQHRYLSKSGLVGFLYLLKSFVLNHSIRIKQLENDIEWLKQHAIMDSYDVGGDEIDG